MIKIKLSRLGRKKAPFYRVVAADARSKRSGQPLEVLGFFNPIKKVLKIDQEKLNSWVKKGAQLTTGVAKLLPSKEKAK